MPPSTLAQTLCRGAAPAPPASFRTTRAAALAAVGVADTPLATTAAVTEAAEEVIPPTAMTADRTAEEEATRRIGMTAGRMTAAGTAAEATTAAAAMLAAMAAAAEEVTTAAAAVDRMAEEAGHMAEASEAGMGPIGMTAADATSVWCLLPPAGISSSFVGD